jgi:hypothetical protein
MNIVLEGPDGSGKSTLAQHILQCVPLIYKGTEGPEKWPGEAIERAYRYLKMDNTLFDRHVIISQNIYGRHRPGSTIIPPELEMLLYKKRPRPLFIYCHATSLDRHDDTSPFDTVEHLRLVKDNDRTIRKAYEEWAKQHAKLTYRIGDSIAPILQACKEHCK